MFGCDFVNASASSNPITIKAVANATAVNQSSATTVAESMLC